MPNEQDRVASISFRQLKLFESIGRLKSVRRASEECALSQPAVTQALAKLEEEIGARLVDRRASGSYLNELGQVFHARVDRFFDQVEQALVELGVAGGADSVKLVARRLSRSQVRALIAIVETGSFAQGARALGLAQASLQRAARDLEGNVRKPLFYRTAAGIMVTPAGIEFGRRMKVALQEIEWGIRELDSPLSGNLQVVIGAMAAGGSVLLGSALEEFLRAHPKTDVKIVTENAPEMLRRLRAGDADFVIGLLPQSPGEDLVSDAFAPTPYSIVGRRGHPLLRKGNVTLDDLLAYDWVVGSHGASRRACFDTLFAGREPPQAPVMTCCRPVIRYLLANSDRLALMTSYELLHEDDGLAEVRYGALLPVPMLGVTMRANWKPTRLHTDFIETLRRHMTDVAAKPQLRQVG